MDFESEKKIRLGRTDRSKKGSIDRAIMPLINLLNNSPGFFTTSSCAGRISIFCEPDSGRKCDAQWLFVWHDCVSEKEFLGAVKKIKESAGKDKLWLREECFIIHIAAKDLAHAKRLLRTAHGLGLKRSGIVSNKDSLTMLEIMGTDHLDCPLFCQGSLLMTEKGLKVIINEANKRLKATRNKLAVLYKEIERQGILEDG